MDVDARFLTTEGLFLVSRNIFHHHFIVHYAYMSLRVAPRRHEAISHGFLKVGDFSTQMTQICK
jgi:hypothetical protein